AKEKEVTFQ
nr:RecName: Full=Scolopendra 5887.74 Da toxin [Scolopendra angulata]